MFFESRIDPPRVSEIYAQCAELFLTGNARAAREEATRLRSGPGPQQAGDHLLCSDISRSGGFHRESFATVKIAHSRHPDNPQIAFEWLRVLAVRGLILESHRRCNEILETHPEENRQLILGLLASQLAQMGLESKAESTFEEILRYGEITNPRVWYELAFGSLCLRRWDDAIARAREAVNRAPQWPRARIFLAQALLARGRTAECRELIRDGLTNGIEDANLEMIAGFEAFQRGAHDAAFNLLLDYQYTWLKQRRQTSLAKILPVLPWQLNDSEGAITRLQKLDPEAAAELRSGIQESRPLVIHLPTMCQEHVLCLPTCVAMVSEAQGIGQDPNELFEAMTGRHGTPMWRMGDEMRRRGFTVELINTHPVSIMGMIDQGVPLVGQLEGLFNNHVEVVSGYDATKEVYYIRDPESWIPSVVTFEELPPRYSLSGDGVVALITPNRQSEVIVDPSWRSPTCAALDDLERACALGDRVAADMASASIPDHSAAVVRRDSIGRGITCTPRQFIESMDRVGRDPSSPPMARLRAILALDSPELLDDVLSTIDHPEKEFGSATMRLVQLGKLTCLGRWNDVLDITKLLIERSPQTESLWIRRAEALAEMGRQEEAATCAETALQLAPDSPYVRSRVHSLFPHQRPLADELNEMQDLIDRYPDSHTLRHDNAALLRSGNDGFAYEQEELRCRKFFPRLPECYGRLADWYLYQGRTDLASDCVDEGRRLIGSDELPPLDLEIGDGMEGEPQDVADDPTELGSADKGALLSSAYQTAISSKPGEPAHNPALNRLRELQSKNQLQWFEAAMLLAIEIESIGISSASEKEAAARTRSVLPDELSGPPLSFLTVVFERISIGAFPRLMLVQLKKWAKKITEAHGMTTEIRFNLALLNEICGDLNSARREYEKIAGESPGFSAAWFRLGEIMIQQGDLEGAVDSHCAAVSAMPGLDGSLRSLLDLYRHLDRPHEAIAVQRTICRMLPYHAGELEELGLLVAQIDGETAAFSEIDNRAAQHSQPAIDLLKARVLAEIGEYQRSRSTLEGLVLDENEVFQRLVTELICALGEDRWELAEPLIDSGLERQPNNLWLLSLKGGRLEQTDSTEAYHFYRSVLERGIHDAHFSTAFLRLIEHDPENRAIELVAGVEDLQRASLARSLSDGLYHLGLIQSQTQFLKWCSKHLPEATDLATVLAHRLVMSNQHDEAHRVARSLYDQDTESPHLIGLMAYCLQDHEPQKALEYLQRQFSMTGTTGCLADIGRSYLLMGDKEKAEKTYRQVLEKDPGNNLALTGLVTVGVAPGDLYENFCSAIERGDGVDTQTLHVLAVNAAREKGAVLPPIWGRTAEQRLRVVLEEGGFHDEKDLLAIALAKWFEVWSDPATARQIRNLVSLWQRINRGIFWPGKAWIPRPEDR